MELQVGKFSNLSSTALAVWSHFELLILNCRKLQKLAMKLHLHSFQYAHNFYFTTCQVELGSARHAIEEPMSPLIIKVRNGALLAKLEDGSIPIDFFPFLSLVEGAHGALVQGGPFSLIDMLSAFVVILQDFYQMNQVYFLS